MTEPVNGGPVIAAYDVRKSYVGGDGSRLEVLQGVDLEIGAGESVAIIGESGSRKSTLLHILGGLDRPSSGEVLVGGVRVNEVEDEELSQLRNEKIGFVFQFHHLLREFTVLENVMMPALIGGSAPGAASERAKHLLAQVGLGARLEHRPAQLSGGEQQRVAVARALSNRPLALLADEPSGNLDPETSAMLHDLLFGVSGEHGTSMVIVTHNMGLARRANRVLRVLGGRLVAATGDSFEIPRHSVV